MSTKKLRSTWDDISLKKYPSLSKNKIADVVIIGGGLGGILTTYILTKAGLKVILLEAEELFTGASLYTTGFITQVLDTDSADLISMFGLKKAKQIWQSHGQAISIIEKIVKKEKINCEFSRCSNYIYANSLEENKKLKDQLRAIKKIGGKVFLKNNKQLGFKNSGYLEIKNQAKFHATKFAASLLQVVKKSRSEVFEHTLVKKIKGNNIITQHGIVTAPYIITATYQPFNNPLEVFLKKGMYKSYVFEAQLPKGKYKEGTYEDLDNPYHYFRLDRLKKYDRIVIGGEDHRRELKIPEKKSFQALEDYLQSIIGKTPYKIMSTWAGPILEPADGLALIGEYDPGKLIMTAFSGNGMTYSALAAIICRDIVLKTKNSWIDLYHPSRIPTPKQLLIKGRDYATEFLKGAVKNTLFH